MRVGQSSNPVQSPETAAAKKAERGSAAVKSDKAAGAKGAQSATTILG